MSAWLYDRLGGFAFQTSDNPNAKRLSASRLTLVQFQQQANGQVVAAALKHPAYFFGASDPFDVTPSSLEECPGRLAEICDRAWSDIALAPVHALDRLGANGGGR